MYASLTLNTSDLRGLEGEIQKSEIQKLCRNATNGVIYIYGSFYDAESGVKKILVQDRRINEPSECLPVNEKPEETSYLVTDENVQWYDDGNGNTVFCIKHKIKSLNGAVVVNVTVMDSAGNGTEMEELTLIKKDHLNLGSNDYWLGNGGVYYEKKEGEAYDYSFYFDKYKSEYVTFDEAEYNEKIKEIFFQYQGGFSTDSLFSLYGCVTMPEDYIEIYCKYVNRDGKDVTQNLDYLFTNTQVDDISYRINSLDVEKIEGLHLTLVVSDGIGNEEEIVYDIPETGTVSYKLNKTDENNGTVEYFSSSGLFIGKVYQVRNLLQEKEVRCFDTVYDFGVEITSEYEYSVCPSFTFDHGTLFVEIPEDLIYSLSSDSSVLRDTGYTGISRWR